MHNLHAATNAASVLHPASLHQLLYQRLHVDVEPLCGPEVGVTARLVEDDLTDALLDQLAVGGPHQGVVPDADQVLQDGEEVGLGRGVHHQVLHQLETLIHIVQLQPNIVESLSKFIKILLLVFIEHFELSLQILALVILQSLEHIDEPIPHKLVAEMNPEVEVVWAGDEGVDEGEAGHPQRLVVPDQQPLDDRLEPLPLLHLARDGDGLQRLSKQMNKFRHQNNESWTTLRK